MSNVATAMQVDDQQRARKLVEACQKIREQVGRIVVGQEDVVEQLLIAILACGHCLLEGVPGLAKTLMVRSLADSMSLTFHRIQFTPDLMPADITGTDIIQENRETGHRDMVFEKGPVFSQMLLADEINGRSTGGLGSHAPAGIGDQSQSQAVPNRSTDSAACEMRNSGVVGVVSGQAGADGGEFAGR